MFRRKVLAVRSAPIRTRSLLALAMALSASTFCFAQSVRVRVVNDKNGHPVSKTEVTEVTVIFNYRNPVRMSQLLRLEIDPNGEAQFSVPSPPPTTIEVDVGLSRDRWDCGCFMTVDTEAVLQKGVVVTPENWGPKVSAGSPDAEPGLIVFRARPITFAESFVETLHQGLQLILFLLTLLSLPLAVVLICVAWCKVIISPPPTPLRRVCISGGLCLLTAAIFLFFQFPNSKSGRFLQSYVAYALALTALWASVAARRSLRIIMALSAFSTILLWAVTTMIPFRK